MTLLLTLPTSSVIVPTSSLLAYIEEMIWFNNPAGRGALYTYLGNCPSHWHDLWTCFDPMRLCLQGRNSI